MGRLKDMASKRDPEILVLLSGGLDSTAALHLYVTEGQPVAAMFVDYGQAAAIPERNAANRITAHYDVPFLERTLLGAVPKSEGEIPMRNACLVALAAMERPPTIHSIAAGIHAGSGYLDCSEAFASLMREIARLQERPVDLLLPFLRWTKTEVLAYAKVQEIPGHLTYSCDRGEVPPCGECDSCGDRREFDAGAAGRKIP